MKRDYHARLKSTWKFRSIYISRIWARKKKKKYRIERKITSVQDKEKEEKKERNTTERNRKNKGAERVVNVWFLHIHDAQQRVESEACIARWAPIGAIMLRPLDGSPPPPPVITSSTDRDKRPVALCSAQQISARFLEWKLESHKTCGVEPCVLKQNKDNAREN